MANNNMSEYEKYLAENVNRIYKEVGLALFEGVKKLEINSVDKLSCIVTISDMINKDVKNFVKMATGQELKEE